MGDLKPLGSEKLNGDEKLKRILELTYYKNGSNNTQTTKADYISESTTGIYGIVKEKDGYYVKKGLNESSLDYIGGMFMKNKNRFSSYAEALKRLSLLKGQEEILNEETKYVLKVNKPASSNEAAVPAPAPAPAPAPEAAPMDAMPPMDAPAPEMPTGDDEMGDETGGAPESGEDKLKVVQKLTGRLGQKLRDIQDDMESDDIKYIINSVLSAVNLDKLDLEDKEEILGKFEDEEDFAGEDGLDDEMGGEMGGEEIPAEEPQPDAELGEVDGIDALENLINMEFEEDDDMMMSSPEKFGDSGYGDTFHFDLKEVGDLEDMYSDEIDDINSKIKDPEFYMDDEESSVEGEMSGDSTSKEIDINELTDIINNSVKETLRKHFE